jgi:hypothetical protein
MGIRSALASARILLVFAVLGLASRSMASVITVPPSLTAGDTYRLVFVTSGTYSASSSSLATYNGDVTSEANGVAALLSLGATWTAIASTATEDALDNISGSSSAPIFLLNGNEVAGSLTSLFGGTLMNAVQISQNGNALPSGSKVWTGTTSSGTADAGHTLGSTDPEQGLDSSTTGTWLQDVASVGFDNGHDLYAISSVLTVPDGDPASVPEPSTVATAVLGGAVLLLAWKCRRAPAAAR